MQKINFNKNKDWRKQRAKVLTITTDSCFLNRDTIFKERRGTNRTGSFMMVKRNCMRQKWRLNANQRSYVAVVRSTTMFVKDRMQNIRKQQQAPGCQQHRVSDCT